MLLVAEPVLGPEERAAVMAVLESGWITLGERVRTFERAFAELHGVADAVAVEPRVRLHHRPKVLARHSLRLDRQEPIPLVREGGGLSIALGVGACEVPGLGFRWNVFLSPVRGEIV